MLTNNEAIRAAAGLIAAVHGDTDLGTIIWHTHLTDPNTKARDLTLITVAAASLARVALDHTNLDTPEILDNLDTLTHFEDIVAHLHDDGVGGD